jgi:hypothetical protein
VVGSRKAEELNLEFLDAGGMPPAIIFIQGGTLIKDAADQLRNYLSGKNKNKHRAVVVEAQSNSGSLEASGAVQVKVERFGSDRAMDAMFMKYDDSTEEHVRVGFRLPPLFLGKAADYNFATAKTAYMVAEEQVFQPERTEFDEVINMTLMKALGLTKVKYRSKPVSLADVDSQLKAIQIVSPIADPESMVDSVNTLTGLSITAAPPPPPPTPVAPAIGPDGVPVPPGAPQSVPDQAALDKAAKEKQDAQDAKDTEAANEAKGRKTAMELVDLAQDYAALHGLTQKREFPQSLALKLEDEVANLSPRDKKAFNTLIALHTFGSSDPDLVAIAGHAHCH